MATSPALDDKYDEFVARYSHTPSIDQFKRFAKIKYLDAKQYITSRKIRKTSADLPTKTRPSLIPKCRANRSYSSYNNIRKPPLPPKSKKSVPPLPPVKSTKKVNGNNKNHQHSYSVDINNNGNNSRPSTPKHIKLINNMYSNRIIESNHTSNSKQHDVTTNHSINNDEEKYQISQKEIIPKPWNNLKINDIESPIISNTRKINKISPQNAINHNNNNSSSNNMPTISPKPWETENEHNNINNVTWCFTGFGLGVYSYFQDHNVYTNSVHSGNQRRWICHNERFNINLFVVQLLIIAHSKDNITNTYYVLLPLNSDIFFRRTETV